MNDAYTQLPDSKELINVLKSLFEESKKRELDRKHTFKEIRNAPFVLNLDDWKKRSAVDFSQRFMHSIAENKVLIIRDSNEKFMAETLAIQAIVLLLVLFISLIKHWSQYLKSSNLSRQKIQESFNTKIDTESGIRNKIPDLDHSHNFPPIRFRRRKRLYRRDRSYHHFYSTLEQGVSLKDKSTNLSQ